MTAHPTTTVDVTVVGSGLLGLATAFELASRGLSVAVIGPRHGDHHGQASRAAGAMLTVFSEVETGHTPARIALEVGERVKARALYEPWLQDIAEAGGQHVVLAPGLWAIANAAGADDDAELAAIAAAAHANGHEAVYAAPADVPGLAPQLRAHRALWLPTEASIDPAALMAALTAAVAAHPTCTWHDTTATSLGELGHHLTVTGADGTTTASAHLVLAAGAATTTLLGTSPLADQAAAPPVFSGRGTSLIIDAPFALPAAVRTVNRGFACGTHLVPRADGTLYLGATNRLSTQPDYTTRASLDEIATLIHDGATEINTQLRDAGIIEARVGHRPLTIDHLPLWGATGHPVIHLATATYRCGILLAPEESQPMHRIPLSRPITSDDEIAAATAVLRSGHLVQGKEVAAFENEFAGIVDGHACVAVNSGTAALQLILTGLGIGPGHDVIVPSFTFAATAHAVSLTGATPVFADITPDTHCLDPDAVNAAITPRTSAVIAVHLFGHPAPMDDLRAVTGRHQLALIEDAAQAHAAALNSRPVGTLATAAAFSFYPTKNMHTIEGGMITTGDAALATRLRLLRNHGMAERYHHEIIGTNARMTDVSAAIGRVQLRALAERTHRRRANATILDAALTGVTTPTVRPGARHVYHQYAIRVPDGRDRLQQRLAAAGIEAAVHYPLPVHRMPAYDHDTHLPNTELACLQLLSLPVHPALTDDDLDAITQAVNG